MAEICCADCEKEFDKDDTVWVCPECDEPICEDCKKSHFCLEEEEEHHNEPCMQCGEIDEDMYELWGDYYCQHCIEEVKKEKQEEIGEGMEEYEYTDYLKEKIADNL